MLFESAGLRAQFQELHPDTRRIVRDLDELLKSMEQPEVYVTSVYRSKEDQRRLYTPRAYQWLENLRAGKPMRKQEYRDAIELRELIAMRQTGTSEADTISKWAAERPSWHRRRTAVDIRTRTYPTDVLAAIRSWLEIRTRASSDTQPWEVITENHGSGPHIHIARRSWDWLPVEDTPS